MSDRSKNSKPRFPLAEVRRGFWLVLALAHTPGLVGAWQAFLSDGFDLGQLGGFAVMVLSMTFFALKVADARFLRFKADRRACVAFCVVVALLHLDVIRPNGAPTLFPETSALVVASVLGAAAVLRVRSLRGFVSRGSDSCKLPRSPAPVRATIWLDLFNPHCWILIYRGHHLRAPPS